VLERLRWNRIRLLLGSLLGRSQRRSGHGAGA
jgi:hypothetical protein